MFNFFLTSIKINVDTRYVSMMFIRVYKDSFASFNLSDGHFGGSFWRSSWIFMAKLLVLDFQNGSILFPSFKNMPVHTKNIFLCGL